MAESSRAVEGVVLSMVAEGLGLDLLDRGAQAAEPGRDLLLGGQDLVVDEEPGDGRQHGHAEVREPLVAGGRQHHAPGDVLAHVGSGQDGERQLQVLGASGEGPLHAHHDGGIGQGRHRELPAPR